MKGSEGSPSDKRLPKMEEPNRFHAHLYINSEALRGKIPHAQARGDEDAEVAPVAASLRKIH